MKLLLFLIFFNVIAQAESSDIKNDKRNFNLNFKPETCTWVADLPRKLISVPDCTKETSKICTGYVVCENESGGKFIRQSTCSSENCGTPDAVACTKQGNFGSKGSQNEKISSSIKNVITNGIQK